MKAIITIGISASGKSTWADGFIEEEEDRGIFWRKIERDCIRKSLLIKKGIWHELRWDKWNPKWESEVTEIQQQQIEIAAQNHQNIIISDTNLNEKFLQSLIFRLRDVGYEIETKEFHISYEEAVGRDNRRRNGVGSSVIAKQMEDFHSITRKKRAEKNSGKRKAIIVDVDGTLSHKCGRDVYDASKSINDYLDNEVDTIIDAFYDTHHVLIISGRKEAHREVTEQWLKKHNVKYNQLLMRKDGDSRSDDIVKEEIFWNEIDPKYEVTLVIDDRPKVCRMWRSIGLKVMQCGNPHIEF